MAASRTLTPEQRSERARKAGLAGNNLDAYVKRVVDRAPELTPEQRDRLASILRSAPPAGRRSQSQVTTEAGGRS